MGGKDGLLGCTAVAVVALALVFYAIIAAAVWAAWEYVVRDLWADAPALAWWQVALALFAVAAVAAVLGTVRGGGQR